jgi:Mg2+ and Co2+ transporter CorA
MKKTYIALLILLIIGVIGAIFSAARLIISGYAVDATLPEVSPRNDGTWLMLFVCAAVVVATSTFLILSARLAARR